MKRAVSVGIALLTTLGLTAAGAATAQQPSARDARFRQLALPKSIHIENLPSHANLDKTVTAVVVLSADSVSTAKQKAEQLGGAFDRKGAERAAKAAQSSLVPKLVAAGATVRTSTSTVLNSITIRATARQLRAIASIPGISGLHVSQPISRANANSDTYTAVDQVWKSLGLTGKGMTIGIIDDGIDYHHADFGGSGDPADYAADDPTVIEPGSFPTAKVVGGYDFVGDAYDASPDAPGETDIPAPDPDPLACGEHGTHVSGTAAGQGVLADGSTFTGPYDDTTLTANSFLVAPGSAPEASIRMYKVFGCDGSVNDDVLLAAIDRAVTDGVSVVNMSLGSAWGSANGPLEQAIDNATALGVLSVVSAGNSGPNAYLVGGPGTANTALSVAAIDASFPTLPGVSITGDLTLTGQNSNAFDFAGASISGTTVDVGLGCAAADYAGTAGKIVVTHRGVCARVDRAILGSAAGAAAVVFVNNSAGLPPVEGVIPGATVPFVGVPNTVSIPDGSSLTLAAGPDLPNPAFGRFASFTSNGLRQDSAPKPDISAPGVNVLSAFVGSGTEGTLLSGTSMAAPHTAGIAILARQAHPTWGPLAVKAALMSTGDPSKVGGWNVVRGGTGLVNPAGAVSTQTFLSTRDGTQHLAFGFAELRGGYEASRTITLNNRTNRTVVYDLGTQLDTLGLSRFSATVSPAVARVEARSSKQITVTLRIRDPQNLPDVSADAFGAQATINGLLVATPRNPAAGVSTLRAPLVLVPYGLSDVVANARRNAAGTVTSINVANRGVHSGTYDTYQWIATDAAGDNPVPSVPDVRDVGVQQFPVAPGEDLLVFDVSTNDRIPTFAAREIDVLLDVNLDDIPDYVTVGIDFGLLTAGAPDGDFQSFTIDLATGDVVDLWSAFAPNNGSTAQLPVLASSIGATGPIAIAVSSWSVLETAGPDVVTAGIYDPTNPAVSNADFGTLAPGASASLPVSVNPTAAAAQGALGWLVVSVDDAAGGREADRVPLARRD